MRTASRARKGSNWCRLCHTVGRNQELPLSLEPSELRDFGKTLDFGNSKYTDLDMVQNDFFWTALMSRT